MSRISKSSSLTVNGAALDSYVSAGTFTTDAFSLENVKGYSLTISCPSTGSPVGTVAVQVCNDNERVPTTADSVNLVTWNTVPFTNSSGTVVTTASISGASTVTIEDSDAMYRWLRLVYTATSGTISVTAHIQIKAW